MGCGGMPRRLEVAENIDLCFSVLPKTAAEVRELLAGSRVPCVTQPGKADLSDWVELMEAVEALCPVWPVAERRNAGTYRL